MRETFAPPPASVWQRPSPRCFLLTQNAPHCSVSSRDNTKREVIVGTFDGMRRRAKRLTRRGFLIGSATGFIVAEGTSQFLVDPLLDDAPVPDAFRRKRAIYEPQRMERLKEIANRPMLEGLEAWRQRSADLSDVVKARATMTATVPGDPRRWIDWQAPRAGRVLFGSHIEPGTLMIDQPDPELGASAEERLTRAAMTGDPRLDLVHYEPVGREPVLYYALALPYADGRVVSVTRRADSKSEPLAPSPRPETYTPTTVSRPTYST